MAEKKHTAAQCAVLKAGYERYIQGKWEEVSKLKVDFIDTNHFYFLLFPIF